MKRHPLGHQLTRGVLICVLCLAQGYLLVWKTKPIAALEQKEASEPQQHLNTPKYPNGIPEHQSSDPLSHTSLQPNVNIQPDPTIQVGPGVVVGPNVLIRGKPMPNPLLKDVLPPTHP